MDKFHMDLSNFTLLWQVDGRVIPGPLFDFGLHMFHNSKVMMKDRNGPFFYLPKVDRKSVV